MKNLFDGNLVFFYFDSVYDAHQKYAMLKRGAFLLLLNPATVTVKQSSRHNLSSNKEILNSYPIVMKYVGDGSTRTREQMVQEMGA